MKQAAFVVFLFISLFSWGQECANNEIKYSEDCFVIHRGDIKDIWVWFQDNGPRSDRYRCSDDDAAPYCEGYCWWLKVEITLKDECISRITNENWERLSCVQIEGSDYQIGVVRKIDNHGMIDTPTFYNRSEDYKKFEMKGRAIWFLIDKDFEQKQPCFWKNLYSTQKYVRSVDTIPEVSIPVGIDKIPELISKIDSNHFWSTCCPIPLYSSTIPSVYIGEYMAKAIEISVNPNFEYETITKSGQYYSLTCEDMKIIKELYEKWWERKKKNPNYKGSALSSSPYSWSLCPGH
ncbi:MAG: hypothetical protein IJQ89_05260 [Bacteroidales bacterium]|nr:hypothetical protein [Bacteroidales bacterium]